MFTPTGQACTSITLAQAQKPQTATPAQACGHEDAQTSGQETARTHTNTLAQLTSQFSAHNARKCRDPSKNGDEQEDEDEDETGDVHEHEHEEDATKRRLRHSLETKQT